jgi:L-ascorbate metabolism protein UlaG (beta-lactamase superfamily)
MFRKSKAAEITGFFDSPVAKNEVALFYLGTSGFIVRTASGAVLFDVAGFLKDAEVSALKEINLILFTHDHMDHFDVGKTVDLVKATGAPVLAQEKVSDKIVGRIPGDKLVPAESGKTYTFGDLTVRALEGVHRGPIMLFQVRMGDLAIFHGGDSGYVPMKEYVSDVALLPVGRMSPTASPENACKMAVDLNPKLAVAMHGSDGQKRSFEAKVKAAMPQTKVLILEPYTGKTISVQAKA